MLVYWYVGMLVCWYVGPPYGMLQDNLGRKKFANSWYFVDEEDSRRRSMPVQFLKVLCCTVWCYDGQNARSASALWITDDRPTEMNLPKIISVLFRMSRNCEWCVFAVALCQWSNPQYDAIVCVSRVSCKWCVCRVLIVARFMEDVCAFFGNWKPGNRGGNRIIDRRRTDWAQPACGWHDRSR